MIEIVNINGIDYIRPGLTIPKMRVGKVVDYLFTGLFSDNKRVGKILCTYKYCI